ncbi:hypothetical protein HY994_00405 [Candidatus Micrarchaeota archaeon]|nr:hypothetical protein [Candidatus Micrarchaeota archaeon]
MKPIRCGGEAANAHRQAWSAERSAVNYDSVLKQKSLGSILRQMDIQRKLGRHILDLGSGPMFQADGATGMPRRSNAIYYPYRGKRVVRVDWSEPNAVSYRPPFLSVRLDAHDLPDYVDPLILHHINRFIKSHGRNQTRNWPRFHTIVVSDVLNYLNFNPVLCNLDRLILPGGRIVIQNTINSGIANRFHRFRPTSNTAILDFFREHGYCVEHSDSHFNPEFGLRNPVDVSGHLMLVVRKMRAKAKPSVSS